MKWRDARAPSALSRPALEGLFGFQFRRWLRITAGVTGVALVIAAVWLFLPQEVPSFATVRSQWTPSDAYLLDRNGEIIDQ